METDHRIHVGDSRELSELAEDSVDLVVTSPPYPMIELWDEQFAELDPEIGQLLDAGNGEAAFERMHTVLDAVWAELERVLVDGGLACINVGDATRSLDGSFRVYQNHVRIVEAFTELGFDPLPEILWRKPANSSAKFMGSGTLPPNAYVTLEHEHILVFRNGSDRRSFEPHDTQRYESTYFWEERNRWFSDLWTDLRGELQALEDDDLRDRSAAYPFEVPYRLISMYSTYGDTVLDPFWGTGTTTLAAMTAGRNSIGKEYDEAFLDAFERQRDTIADRAEEVLDRRLRRHRSFVENRQAEGNRPEYTAEHYDMPVVTKQERSLRLYRIASVEATTSEGDTTDRYSVQYDPIESVPDEHSG